MQFRQTFLVLLSLALTACSPSNLINALVPEDGYRLVAAQAYGSDAAQRLDVYVPQPVPRNAPVVVFFYGGRWTDGERANYQFAGEALSSRGYVVVIPDYRQYPEVRFPVFIEDGAAAVVWARAHAAEFGGDPQRLFVMGHSSGAHIAAMLALNPEYLRKTGGNRDNLAGMIGLAGAYDFLPLTANDLKEIFAPPERYALSQPITYADGRNPPLFLLHGQNDESVLPKNTINLAARVQQNGGPVQTLIYPSMSHTRIVAALAKPLRFAGSVLEDVAGFINGTKPAKIGLGQVHGLAYTPGATTVPTALPGEEP